MTISGVCPNCVRSIIMCSCTVAKRRGHIVMIPLAAKKVAASKPQPKPVMHGISNLLVASHHAYTLLNYRTGASAR